MRTAGAECRTMQNKDNNIKLRNKRRGCTSASKKNKKSKK
jgi:hypothetical protein